MMLGRVLGHAVRLQSRRTPAPSLLVASTQATRYASNNRRSGSKKPFDYNRQGSNPESPRPSSIGPQQGDSNKPGDIRSQNPSATSNSERINRTTQNQAQDASENVNFEDSSSPSASTSNAAEQGQTVNAEENPQMPNQLPDLTKGIPSTWAYESMERMTKDKSVTMALNLTEEPSQDGSGKRGRGELPASAYVSSSEKKRLKVANYLYAGVAGASILGYIWLGRNWDTEEEEKKHPNAPSGWAMGLMWNRVKARTGGQLDYYKKPAFEKLLPDPDPSFARPYTLVLSLEDLLIHSEWSRDHGWRMAKRPGIDYFLRYLSQYYELVIFTSQPYAIAEPVIRKLDPFRMVTWPLYREATFYKNGEYIKDLSYLNRDLSKTILIDTVAAHASSQPNNAIILPKWHGDSKDSTLVALIPFLEFIPALGTPDVRTAIKSFEGTNLIEEFAKREAIARKKFEEQMAEEKKKRPKSSGLGFISKSLGVDKPMLKMEGEVSAAEGFAQGKMLQDQARERGQRNYELLEQMIRENGEKWLKEEAATEELMRQEGMKQMKSGLTGFFGVPGSGGSKPEGTS